MRIKSFPWLSNFWPISSSVQWLSHIQYFATPWTAARQASCPSPTPRDCSNSCPLSRWCHPTISSSVIPFSSCLQSFQASGSFLMSQFFTSGGQNVGASASASVLPVNIQGWFPTDSNEDIMVSGRTTILNFWSLSQKLYF